MSLVLEKSVQKTYKEVLLTPSTTPNTTPYNSPAKNIFLLGSKDGYPMGIIDKRLKWYLNRLETPENGYSLIEGFIEERSRMCSSDTCLKMIDFFEWNSYYTVYVERYKNILDEQKIKIYNDFNKYEKCIYCDDCKHKIEEEFMETRKKFKLDLFKL